MLLTLFTYVPNSPGSLPIACRSERESKSIAAYLSNLPPMNARHVIPAYPYVVQDEIFWQRINVPKPQYLICR